MAKRDGIVSFQASRLFWPIVALVLLLLYNFLFTQNFFHVEVKDGRLFGTLIDILNRGTPVMLLALGMTLVIATGGVDISVGATMAVTGALAASLLQKGESLGVVLLIPLLAGLAIGVWNGFLVAWVELQPIVATLVLMVAGRGVAQLITDGQILTFEHDAFEYIANGFLFGLPFPITIVVVLSLLVGLLTRKTALGLFIESVGANEKASRFAGVNVKMVKLSVYAFTGFCAAVAGLIAASNIKGADSNNVGLYLEMDAILATVIGGTSMTGGRFSLIGSVIGALIIQTLTTTILSRGVPVELTLVVKAVVVLAVCLLQSPEFRQAFTRRWRTETP